MAPPDAVAATSIFQRLGVPRRDRHDPGGREPRQRRDGARRLPDRARRGRGRFVLGPRAPASRSSRWASAGSLFGLLMGIVISWVLKRVDDPVFSVVLTFLAPVATFLPAERFGISGVLATVAAGIWLGRHAPRDDELRVRVCRGPPRGRSCCSSSTAPSSSSSALQLPSVLEGLTDRTPAELIGLAVVISAVVIVVRILWVFPGTYAAAPEPKAIRPNEPYPPLATCSSSPGRACAASCRSRPRWPCRSTSRSGT